MNDALYLLGFSPRLVSIGAFIRNTDANSGIANHLSDLECFDPATLALAELYEIERLEAGPVLAWFKRIDRSEFVGETGEKNLADIQWLTPRVMAHEEAVGQLSSQSSFYPARFGTLFSTDSSLASFAVSVGAKLVEFFRTIRGKHEWGLKLFGNISQVARLQAEQCGLLKDGVPTKGANYLKLKQMQREISQRSADAFHDSLEKAKRSIEAAFPNVVERSMNGSSRGESVEQLLANIAVLEFVKKKDSIESWVANWNKTNAVQFGIRLELSGPWPAYSFCPPLTSSDAAPVSSVTETSRSVA